MTVPEPDITVLLTGDPLHPGEAATAVSRPDCGGIALFLGAVRRDQDGPEVAALEYEAWDARAESAMRRVGENVAGAHPDARALYLAHRTGRLGVGEVSVIVAAAAPHRPEAFAAARALIDELKAEVPIWKREEFVDGAARWPGTDV